MSENEDELRHLKPRCEYNFPGADVRAAVDEFIREHSDLLRRLAH